MRKLFGIIGYDDPGRSNAVPPATFQAAEEVGSLIACRGAILVSGGRGGGHGGSLQGSKQGGRTRSRAAAERIQVRGQSVCLCSYCDRTR